MLGSSFSGRGIEVDNNLRTTQKHIHAAGGVTGRFQFTHYAALQASVAVRTMLFPGSCSRSGPWTVFTEPEVAQCGLSKGEARTHSGIRETYELAAAAWTTSDDQDLNGFIKVIHTPDGEVLAQAAADALRIAPGAAEDRGQGGTAAPG